MGAGLCGPGQAVRRNERVVERIHRQRRNAHRTQQGPGGGAAPVVVRVAEAVQGCREQIVEGVQVAHRAQGIAVEEARVLAPLGQGLRHHGVQEHARIDEPVESLPDGTAARGEVERGTYGRRRVGGARGLQPMLARPAQQCVAAERHSGHEQGRAGPGRGTAGPLPLCHAPQDPVNFLVVARMVGARRKVDLAAASTEVRHGIVPAADPRHAGERLGIVAARRALQPMEEHQQRPGWPRCRGGRLQEVHVHEIAVRRRPSLPPVGRHAALGAARRQRGPDGLQVAAGKPPGRYIVHGAAFQARQCSTGGTGPATASWTVPGLAWWATRRQPCGVL